MCFLKTCHAGSAKRGFNQIRQFFSACLHFASNFIAELIRFAILQSQGNGCETWCSMIASLPFCRFGDKSSRFCSFVFVNLCLVSWAPHNNKSALSQEWCQNVGVIADEAGIAVDAIKAWGKELIWASKMGLQEKDNIYCKLHKKRLYL